MGILNKLFRKKTVEEKIKDQTLSNLKSDGIKKGSIAVVFLMLCCTIAFYFFQYFISKIQEDSMCKGICTQDYSQVLASKGHKRFAKLSKEVWYVQYHGAFTVGKAEAFAELIDNIFLRSKAGDVLVLNIESIGGSATSCSHSYNRLERIKSKGVKIVAVTDYLSASCGYMLSSVADEITASDGAMVGNIGSVINITPSVMQLLLKRFGYEDYTIGSSRTKEVLGGALIETEEDRKIIQDLVDMGYEQFKQKVLKYRANKIAEEDRERAFSGMIFPARVGYELGIVDNLRDLRSTLNLYYIKGYQINRVYVSSDFGEQVKVI